VTPQLVRKKTVHIRAEASRDAEAGKCPHSAELGCKWALAKKNTWGWETIIIKTPISS
jgi:hypothetical protein